MRVGLVQLCSGDSVEDNLVATEDFIREAAGQGAEFVATPEVTNLITRDRSLMAEVLKHEQEDDFLAAMQRLAQELDIWLLLGSLSLKSETGDRFVNRSLLIAQDGRIVARYDKLHMFDVNLPDGERIRESATYRPGNRAVLAAAGEVKIGMSICYDLRFPALYQRLARTGAEIITIPAAFTVPTGKAHWEVLLRARAIETGAFILAPAQTGVHSARKGKPRESYGHSKIVDPWGKVVAAAGLETGVIVADIALDRVAQARSTIPSRMQEAVFTGP